ncbi:hypothetical protein [Nostoc sp. GT001]|uniref:hypothetical protein n=1 Tax=Nostoc sp. GT001 TaxID=3056647 RepID=UPI0025AB3714|nr:hypothetical protein [Nostoc sp. GT001]MDM9583151.1 hypothetical protein [Nostoc sp. GT001]
MKLLILDLDNTVRRPKSGAKFISDPLDQEIIAGSQRAIAHYKSQGWLIVGATNQGANAANIPFLWASDWWGSSTEEDFPW